MTEIVALAHAHLADPHLEPEVLAVGPREEMLALQARCGAWADTVIDLDDDERIERLLGEGLRLWPHGHPTRAECRSGLLRAQRRLRGLPE